MEPVIGLNKGGKFDFRTQGHDDLTLQIVAKSLSQTCRFTGHVDEFYSVAQHSVYVSRLLVLRGYPQYAMWGLLHDTPESVYGDHSSPLKSYLQERTNGVYRQVIKEIDEQVLTLFEPDLYNTKICHYTDDCREKVKHADYTMLYLERDALLAETKYLYPDGACPELHPGGEIRDIDPCFEPWSCRRAEHVFLKEYEDICNGKHLKFKRRYG